MNTIKSGEIGPYSQLIGKYVRIFGRVNATGKLENLNLNFGATINPSLVWKDTYLVKIVEISNEPKIIPYNSIDAIEGLERGEEYMHELVRNSMFATIELLVTKKNELMQKGIREELLDKELDRLIDKYREEYKKRYE